MMMGKLLPFQLGNARKIFILIFDNVILGSLLVEGDSLPKELKPFVSVALVFALVQVSSRIALELLLNSNEVLLGMRSYLGARSSLDVLLDSLPVFSINPQSCKL